MSTHTRTTQAYVTLGDIADELLNMKADGMTYQSIMYALERVYGVEMEQDRKANEKLRSFLAEGLEELRSNNAKADHNTELFSNQD